jgi:two-component system chemotaxis sensor kinase CheA
MSEVKELAHQCEEYLVQIQNKKIDNTLPPLQRDLNHLQESLDRFCQTHSKIIGVVDPKVFKNERSLPIQDLERISRLLEKAFPKGTSEYREFYESLVLQPIEDAFAQFELAILSIAERQEKQVEFHLIPSAPPIRVNIKAYGNLFGSLIHAFRNAVDHGIELPSDRMEKSKSPKGKIEVSFDLRGDLLVIQVSDDGKGIDPELIRRLATQKQLKPSDELARMSAEEVIQLIFTPGFSSSSTVTDVSGRGVGLDAVQVEAKQLSGRAYVNSKLGLGSQLIVEVPLKQ